MDLVADSSPLGIISEVEATSDKVVSRVLEIVPDIEPGHLTTLVTDAIPTFGAGALEHIVYKLLEAPRYPKVAKKTTEKRNHPNAGNDSARPSKRSKFDYSYGDSARPFLGGADYSSLALVR